MATELTNPRAHADRDALASWPPLPLREWADTYATLHRWLQIVGKTRLAAAPMQNHWWNVTLYLTSRGLTTSPMPCGARTFEVELDFIEHVLAIRASDGDARAMTLGPRPVDDFYREYTTLLAELGASVHIWPVPVELPDTLRFDQDQQHATYDPDAAHRCWRILASTDQVLKAFRGRFLGKSSPSHFWWGSFDLACTRFSGRPARRHSGGIPNCPDYVTVEAYSHECCSAGWWPGSVGGVEEPAFYAYAYPEPDGCAAARIGPAGAFYHSTLHEWIFPYDTMRAAPDPDAALLEFYERTYAAAATLGHWDRAALERPQ